MILPEERLKEIFDELPAITIGASSYTPIYDFGSQKDLYRFLNLKRKEVTSTGSGNIYPIIWMETPVTKVGTNTRLSFPLTLVIATLTNSTMSNLERLAVSFDTVLTPLYDNILTGLQQSGFTQIVPVENNQTNSVTRTDYFNYGTENDQNHETTDVWDAIKLECTVLMTDKCLRTINF